MSDQTPSASSEPESYAAAEAELRAVLEALEADNVDVDALIGLVERARELIAWCRTRVAETETTITELLDGTDDSA